MALGNGAPDVFASLAAVRSGQYRTGFGAILSAGTFVSALVVGFVAIYAARGSCFFYKGCWVLFVRCFDFVLCLFEWGDILLAGCWVCWVLFVFRWVCVLDGFGKW